MFLAPHLAAGRPTLGRPTRPHTQCQLEIWIGKPPRFPAPKTAVKRYGICWVADWWICSWFGCVDDEVSELTRPGLTCKIADWLLIVQEMVFQRQLQASSQLSPPISTYFGRVQNASQWGLGAQRLRHRKKSIGSKKWLPYPSNSFFRVWVPDDILGDFGCVGKVKRNQEPHWFIIAFPSKIFVWNICTVSCPTIRHKLESVSAQFPGFRDTVAKWTDGASSLGVGHLVAATSAIGSVPLSRDHVHLKFQVLLLIKRKQLPSRFILLSATSI